MPARSLHSYEDEKNIYLKQESKIKTGFSLQIFWKIFNSIVVVVVDGARHR